MLPLLRESPAGRIVNVGGSSGSLTLNTNPEFQYCNIFGAAYSPSETALSATTLAFAIELKNTNIKVNVVCPGYVVTELNDFRGLRTVEQGAKQSVKMAVIGPDGPNRHLHRRRWYGSLVTSRLRS
jgi:NAD(P)-dependent dehydrogenase (short-subunit alcohol dehydrogenase family)